MNQREIEELLNRHADQLLGAPAAKLVETAAGRPAGESLSVEQKGLFASLARLAERVQAALVRVEPRPDYVIGLKGRLLASTKPHANPGASTQQRRAWLAGVGGALLLASLGILSYKMARAGMGWVAASRAGRPEAAKAPPVA